LEDRYVSHPQWEFNVDLGIYWLLINWALRFSPLSKAEAVRNLVYRIRDVLSGRLFRRLSPGIKPASRPAAEPGSGPT
jgi:hypothetical protein